MHKSEDKNFSIVNNLKNKEKIDTENTSKPASFSLFEIQAEKEQQFSEMLEQAKRGKLSKLDFSSWDLTPSQLFVLHEFRKDYPNIRIELSVADMQEYQSMIAGIKKDDVSYVDKSLHQISRSVKSFGNGKGLDDKLQGMKSQKKHRFFGNGTGLDDKLHKKMDQKKKRSLGNEKGLDDKLNYSLLDRIFIFMDPSVKNKSSKGDK